MTDKGVAATRPRARRFRRRINDPFQSTFHGLALHPGIEGIDRGKSWSTHIKHLSKKDFFGAHQVVLRDTELLKLTSFFVSHVVKSFHTEISPNIHCCDLNLY